MSEFIHALGLPKKHALTAFHFDDIKLCQYCQRISVANKSLTSTSWADLDTNFIVDFTNALAPFEYLFWVNCQLGGGSTELVDFRARIDGVTMGPNTRISKGTGIGIWTLMCIMIFGQNISIGTHNFRIQYAIQAGSTVSVVGTAAVLMLRYF